MKNEKRKLPERWAKSKLFELAEYINGKAFKPEEWEKEGTPIIRIENLTDKKAPFNYYRDECEEKYKIVDGNLLVSWSATLDAFIWQRGSAYLNQHIFKVVPSENKVNTFFLYFLLRYSMKKLRENIHGATMQHITKPKFDNFEVIHPKDIDDQIRIASELERKMAEVEKMRQAALSQKEAIAAMQGAILRDVFPYKEGEKLPEGWRWEKLCNILELKYGNGLSKDYRKKGFVPVFGSNGVVGYHSEAITKGKTIIIGRKGSAGEVVWSNTACWPIDTTYFVDELKIDCDLRFIYYILKFLNLTELDKSSAVPGLNRDDVYAIQIPLPPTLNDQIRVANELERKMAETEKMRQAADNQLEAIEALPGAILRVAFDFEEEEAS